MSTDPWTRVRTHRQREPPPSLRPAYGTPILPHALIHRPRAGGARADLLSAHSLTKPTSCRRPPLIHRSGGRKTRRPPPPNSQAAEAYAPAPTAAAANPRRLPPTEPDIPGPGPRRRERVPGVSYSPCRPLPEIRPSARSALPYLGEHQFVSLPP